MSLYTELIEAGVEVSNHCSDLYFPVTAETQRILNKHPLEKGNSTTFRSNVSGQIMYDVPFAFEPWWTRRGVQS